MSRTWTMAVRRLACVSGMALLSGICCAQDLGNGAAPSRNPDSSPADTAQVRTVSLPVLSAAEMSQADADLLNAREAEVSRAAAFLGFDISDSSWNYQQVVCRTLPDHLILSFSNASSPRGPSHFVAVVPHGTDKVEVVSSFAHGLLPFRPAAEREGSFGVFNRMVLADRGEKSITANAHWLNLAMCYAAVAGVPVQAAEMQDDVAASQELAFRHGSTPIIRIGSHGAADVAFSDVRLPDKTENWALSFDRDGRLRHVNRSQDGPLKVRRTPIASSPVPILPE